MAITLLQNSKIRANLLRISEGTINIDNVYDLLLANFMRDLHSRLCTSKWSLDNNLTYIIIIFALSILYYSAMREYYNTINE